VPLGYWVLAEACRQTKRWQEDLQNDRLGISVNLSTKQFLQPDLVSTIERILHETALPPDTLYLEITESAIMTDPTHAAQVMQHLHTLGVRFYVDDFGTGYSSLSYLHTFPFYALKIDRSFVQAMRLKQESVRIVETILRLAKNLNLQVVAEGIEEAEQAQGLKELDCLYGQGYFFAKPLNAHDAKRWLEQQTHR
jgi:EAL domain-containing protein (putative c-di-GMP-specific phosphodiesterase class I)